MTGTQDIPVHAPPVIAQGVTLNFVCSVMIDLYFYAPTKSESGFGLEDLAFALGLVVHIRP